MLRINASENDYVDGRTHYVLAAREDNLDRCLASPWRQEDLYAAQSIALWQLAQILIGSGGKRLVPDYVTKQYGLGHSSHRQ